jgi:hypothetical protein
MDPRTFLAVAIELAGGNTPAHQRSATSRAYYAVFNTAADFLRASVPISKGAGAHGEVQHCLASCGDANVAAAGSDLHALHSRRIRADYRLDVTDPENRATVQATMIEAGEMINALEASFNNSGAAQLRVAIRQYWRDVLRKPL